MVRISVVIPVKNAALTIGRTLESLKSQSYQDFEVLIVDGGSNDGTIEVIQASELAEVKLIREPGTGISAAVNIGIERAKGEVVMPWLCADDYLDPGYFSAVAACWSEDRPDYIYGNWHGMSDGKVFKSRVPEKGWKSKLRYAMPRIMSNSFVFRRDLFSVVGPLDESIKYACDYDFILRVVSKGYRGAYCPGAWYYYQTGGLSQSRFLEVAREVATIARRHGANPLLAYYYFCKEYLRVNVSFIRNRYRAAV